MKYFLLGTAFAVVLAAGSALLVSSFAGEPVSAEVVKDCTWSEVKDCYSGNPSPNNPCCAPKVQMEQVARDCTWSQVKECWNGQTNPCCPPKVMEQQIGKNCTWTEVKLCYDGIANQCCPPKQMQMSQATVTTPSDADITASDELARKCTWGEIKACYSGGPIPPNSCCPPKQMDNPIG